MADMFEVAALDRILQGRKSCRKFRACIMPDNDMQLIISAAARAPYASGGPRVTTYRSSGNEALRLACVNQDYARDASLAILFSGHDTDSMLRSKHPKYVFDCVAACMCSDLMAVSLGYGTCWIGNFYPDMIRAAFGVSGGQVPVIILLVGRRNDDGKN